MLIRKMGGTTTLISMHKNVVALRGNLRRVLPSL